MPQPQAKEQNSPIHHISLLGGFRIVAGAEPAGHVSQPRLQLLLAYLILHRQSAQSRSQLAYLFWPETNDKQAHTNLRKLLYLLRRALPDADRRLCITAGTVQWRDDAPAIVDVIEFEGAIAAADLAEKQGDRPTMQRWLEEAVDRYPGELLPEFYEDWVLAERERLGQHFARSLARLIQVCEEGRDYRSAIEHAKRLLRHDPLHESNYRRLMRLHACNGTARARCASDRACVAVLARELDVAPSPKTTDLYQRLINVGEKPSSAIASSAMPEDEAPLVGRRHEWRILSKAWQRARHGQPQVVLISGEAGIGKTRLATQLADDIARQGFAVAAADSSAIGEPPAFGPVVQWLRAAPIRARLERIDEMWLIEVSRLLPELRESRPDLPSPGPIRESWQKQPLYEALARIFLMSDEPLLSAAG